MTVDRDTGISESFVGSGTTGPFAVTNFNIMITDQLEPGGVYKVLNATGVVTTLILNDPGANGYTAAIVSGLVTINTVAAVASGYTLYVLRNTDKLQTVALPVVGRFQPRDIEEALDLLSMQVQELSPTYIAAAEALDNIELIPTGWANSSRDWAEIEVSVDIESQFSGAVDLQLSLDNGVTALNSGYEWVVTQAYGTGFAGSVTSYVGSIASELQRWRLSGDLARKPDINTAGRFIGNYRITGLAAGKATKIVGAGTFTTPAGEFVRASIGGVLDSQISLINGVIVSNPVVNSLVIGSRIDVRGIR